MQKRQPTQNWYNKATTTTYLCKKQQNNISIFLLFSLFMLKYVIYHIFPCFNIAKNNSLFLCISCLQTTTKCNKQEMHFYNYLTFFFFIRLVWFFVLKSLQMQFLAVVLCERFRVFSVFLSY